MTISTSPDYVAGVAEGYRQAVEVVRVALATARAEPRWAGACRCGRSTIVSERAGRITALGNLLADLGAVAP